MEPVIIENVQQLELFVKENTLQDISFSFKNKEMNDTQIIELLNVLKNLKSVNTLSIDLSGNRISFIANQAILNLLQSQINVATLILDLTNNRLGNQGAKQWADFLAQSNAPKSIALSLRFNKIEDEGAIALATMIGAKSRCPNLEIDIRSNQFPIIGHMEIQKAYNTAIAGLKIYCEDLIDKSEDKTQFPSAAFFKPYPAAPHPKDNPYIRGVWPKSDTHEEEDNIFTSNPNEPNQ